MRRLLIKLSTLIVIFHMACGCSWHHGLFRSGECHVTHAELCDHVHHCSEEQFTYISTDQGDGKQHKHHFCHCDNCLFQTAEVFKFDIEFQPRLSWGEGVSAKRDLNTNQGDSYTSSWNTAALALPLRTHLLNGVQLL